MSKDQKSTGFKVVGTFTATEKYLSDGNVIDTFSEKNVITDIGIDHLLRSFSDDSHENQMVATISLGNDIGNGTILEPEQPVSSLNIDDHDSIYEVPSGEFFISYPNATTVRFFATINGDAVMDSFPSQPNVVYTSAILKTGNLSPQAFAFKRFSARTISDLISVDISWEVEFVQV